MSADAQALMRSIIQRIATGPELSKNISSDEARAGMRAILEKQIHPVQMTMFLIALRMKRETDEEFIGILQAIRDLTTTVVSSLDEILDIADPYDGFNRTLPPSPFLPAILATCGVPTVSHGLETLSPKYGITHRQILRAAGIPVDLTPEQSKNQLESIGWTYIDQRQYCPALHDMAEFRNTMIKRSALTTVETLAGPFRGKSKTHVVNGYVHKAYPRIYALLAQAVGFDSALLIRGTEGGIIPSLRQPAKCFYYHDLSEVTDVTIDPTTLDIHQTTRAISLEENAEELVFTDENKFLALQTSVEMGLAALRGKLNATRDALIYSGALCLWHLKRFPSLESAAIHIRTVLDNGSAFETFNKAKLIIAN
jgi:anthranilate phosphoribosyltransferase